MAIFGMVSLLPSISYTLVGLDSFLQNTKLEPGDELIVFDNDRSFDLISRFLPNSITVIKNQSPLSFSANINQAVNLASEKKTDLYFLNNDLYFPAGWLEPLRSAPQNIITSPLSNREVQLRTGEIQWVNNLRLSDLIGREKLLERGIADLVGKGDGYKSVVSLPFFCVKLPLAVMQKVGLFDEGFGPGGGEDYDYCIRSLKHEFSIAYALKSYVLHFNGKSTWSGAESAEGTATRCESYRRYFREKWGDKLFRLYIEESEKVIDECGLMPLAASGKFGELIDRLMS